MPESKPLTPAYVPFKTFIVVLDSFGSFLPDRIDTSMWPSYSGGIKSQLIGALKFLRLIEDDGTVTEALRTLAHTPAEQRGKAFQPVMREAYGQLTSLDLTKATPASFDAELRKFGQDGETHRKAASFFLQAARWSGIPLSPLLLKKGSLSGARRKRVPNGTAGQRSVKSPAATANISSTLPILSAGGSVREIVLSDGSKLLLKTEKDLFQMASDDRKFTMKLLEMIESYEDENPYIDVDNGEDEDS
ncbi:hypothetical protein [Silvibacterium sp.]|uniref:hypothetical protein n=1 Tax=Silvibacterium sp. TaxID=1964179 RepID=UPI0039E56636